MGIGNTTRTTYDGSYISTTAHNEYLEAAIEGGVVRFALTVALAVAAAFRIPELATILATAGTLLRRRGATG